MATPVRVMPLRVPVRINDEPPSQPPAVHGKDKPGPWLKPNPPCPPANHAQRESQIPLPITTGMSPASAPAYDISAHTVQFVASPGQTRKLQSAIPATIREVLGLVPALAGCMVMVSDQEARLVTVVTLWSGKERVRHSNENADCIKKLLAPYVDHWLRSENHLAHLSMLTPLERNSQERH